LWVVYSMSVVGWWGDTNCQSVSNLPWSLVVGEGFPM